MLHVYFTDVCLDLGFFKVQSFTFTKISQTHIHQTPTHCIYNIWKPATKKMRFICKEIREEIFSRINIALLHIWWVSSHVQKISPICKNLKNKSKLQITLFRILSRSVTNANLSLPWTVLYCSAFSPYHVLLHWLWLEIRNHKLSTDLLRPQSKNDTGNF